jgi:hypothetical protein
MDAPVHAVDNVMSAEYFGAIGVGVWGAVVVKYYGRPSWCRG